MAELPPMGEADVKFLRWAEHFGGDCIAFSIDGDFIPIALMRYEEQSLQRKLQEQRIKRTTMQNAQSAVPGSVKLQTIHNIAIYRMKYKPPQAAAATKKPSATARVEDAGKKAGSSSSNGRQMVIVKNARNNRLSIADASAPAAPTMNSSPEASSQHSKHREYEYVDIPRLYAAMRDAFDRFCPSVPRNPLHRCVSVCDF